MHPIDAFLWGSLGSFAIEIVSIVQTYQKLGRAPARYRSFWFWAARTALVGIAGGLSVAFNPASPMVAIYIGVAAPLILERLASTPLNDGTSLPPPPAAANAERRLPDGPRSRGSNGGKSRVSLTRHS
jgi:hypothetical protein